MNPFESKSVVVTGATSGIGRSLCLEFHRRGAFVYAASRNEGELRALAAECGDARIVPVVLDVTDEPAFGALLARVVSERGTLDYK